MAKGVSTVGMKTLAICKWVKDVITIIRMKTVIKLKCLNGIISITRTPIMRQKQNISTIVDKIVELIL